MKNYQKYQKQYFMPPVDCFDWVKKEQVEKRKYTRNTAFCGLV